MRTRFYLVTLMLLLTAGILQTRATTDKTPPSPPLNGLPHSIGSYRSTDVPIDSAVLQILGSGRFLNRLYFDRSLEALGHAAKPVSLFIGYFPTQRTGQSIHSPQNCLPGAGWSFESSRDLSLTDVTGKKLNVGEYVITDGTVRQEVLYWYRAHGRSIASDYQAKLFLMADAIRFNRTDGALVRIITPILTGETAQQAHDRAIGFAAQTAPLLPTFIPD